MYTADIASIMPNSDLDELSDYGLPPVYIEHLEEDRDPESLWQTQQEALEAGLLDDDNFLMVSEPGTGKTLAAEFAIVQQAMRTTPSVFLVPYRALAEEKAETFRTTIGDELDLDIATSLGGERHEPTTLFEHDVLVMTYEKFDYHLRNHSSHVRQLGLVAIDEFHTMGKPSRGPNLEIAVTRLLADYPDIRILGLSATAPNTEELAEWLDAKYSNSGNWRQVPLYEGTFVDSNDEEILRRPDGEDSRQSIERYTGSEIDPIIDYLGRSDETSCLVFAPTRGDAEEIASKLRDFQTDRTRSTPVEIDEVATTRAKNGLAGLSVENTGIISELKQCVNQGIGFHHAGVPEPANEHVIEQLSDGALRVIVSTTGLGAGINLPVDRVFITKPRLGGDSDEYGRDMLVGEYKNLAGRAGRPQFTDHGESVLYADNALNASHLRDGYLDGEIERIESEIDVADRQMVLNLLHDCASVQALREYLTRSFYGQHGAGDQLEPRLLDTLQELQELEMVESIDDGAVELTPLGEATSTQLIDPLAVAHGHAYLQQVDSDSFKRTDLFAVLAATPLLEKARLFGWKQYNCDSLRDRLPLPSAEELEDKELENAIITAQVVSRWIDGDDLDQVFEELNVANSRTSADISERAAPLLCRGIKVLLEVLVEVDNEQLYSTFADTLETLESQTRYGLSEEEVPFATYDITTDRGMISHLIDNVGISHPRQIIEGDITQLFGQLDYGQAFKFTRTAINKFCESPDRERKHTLLDAWDEGPGMEEIRPILEADTDEFQRCCERHLQAMPNTLYEKLDEAGQKKVPEGILRILDGDDETHSGECEPLIIAVECKSSAGLSDNIGSDKATDILRKANDQPHLVTIGTPDFTEDAVDAAKRQGVLLLPAASFATLVIRMVADGGDPDDYADVFSQSGRLSRPQLLQLLGEWE